MLLPDAALRADIQFLSRVASCQYDSSTLPNPKTLIFRPGDRRLFKCQELLEIAISMAIVQRGKLVIRNRKSKGHIKQEEWYDVLIRRSSA